MNRRDFLRSSGLLLAGWELAHAQRALGLPANGWRTFELTTRVDLHTASAPCRVWVPGPLATPSPFQRTLGTTVHCPDGHVSFHRDPAKGLEIIQADFSRGSTPQLTVTRRVACRDWAIDLRVSAAAAHPQAHALQAFLEPTRYIPTDGIVKQQAETITRGARTDLEKARVLYEWIVENTYRDPRVRGCGVGDIRFMLESGDLGGKCADLNALFVGLARAAGLPARDLYGIRVAPSELGYKSLGASSQNITKAQHCRAEVFLHGYGWTPVDPADVRKVMLEEPPGHLPPGNAKVEAARARLFGSWEMNWVAFNYAQDVTLPGSQNGPLHFLMYPQAERGGERLDCLDPDHFCYQIEAREIHSEA